MSSQPPPQQKSPQPAAAKPAAAAGPAPKREDTLETSERNKYVSQSKVNFAPTPLKKAQPAPTPQANSTGEFAPIRPTTPRARSTTTASTTPASTPSSNAFLMPGAGAPIVEEARQPMGRQQQQQRPATPAKPEAPKPVQTAAGAQPQRTPSNPRSPPPKQPGGQQPQQTRESNPRSPPPKQQQAPAPKSAGLITSGDVLGYQGKLPVYVGRAADGNPMVDAEDARFTFDPKGQRVQLECKVAAIMMKAACLHLGLPPPERGPRRFNVVAQLKPDVVVKHLQKLFDGNLEVRLGAQEEGRPVLLDLTVYQNITLTPDG